MKINRSLLLYFVASTVVLFIVLYGFAAILYPGGSSKNTQQIGFSFFNNYWCNLLDPLALNGKKNVAMPLARAALFILTSGLTVFWYITPTLLDCSKRLKHLIQGCGIAGMLSCLLLLSSLNHDWSTNLASGFGGVALIALLAALYQNKKKGLFNWGCLNLGLMALNNILYYNSQFIDYLPAVQKITFAMLLLWVLQICRLLLQTIKKKTQKEVIKKML